MRRTEQKDRRLGISLAFTIQVILVLTLTATLSHAATVRVPSEQPTIQAGVDAANESDTVLVAPGTYTGPGNYDILLDGKGLVVRSESGPAVTIIDCEGNGRGFTLDGPMATDPVINGFTVKNGEGGDSGGAVYSYRAAVRIEWCVLANNVSRYGGGAYVQGYGGSLYFSNCTLIGNTAHQNGSACYGWDTEFLIMEKCLIYANETISGGEVVRLVMSGSIELICCDLYRNVPLDWSSGTYAQYAVDGNISVPPLLCDPTNGLYGLHAESPLRPENGPCGELVGALGVSCADCYDVDTDGLCAAIDNCPAHSNADQQDDNENGIGDACEDEDGDGLLSPADNCPWVNNPFQEDMDIDGIGDVCDDDIDGDGYANDSDNCPENYNLDQADFNDDGVGDLCCCDGRVGNANGLGGDEPTIGDLSVMIDAKFITGTCDGIIVCLAEADVNQSGGCYPTCNDITIGDMGILIDYLFITSRNLRDCLVCP